MHIDACAESHAPESGGRWRKSAAERADPGHGGLAGKGRPVRSSAREENQRLILEAAETVFAEQGFKGATTGEIAERAGLPKANVHYYFPSKLDLYREVMARVLERWLAAADSLDDSDDPEEALGRYIAAKMELSRTRPLGSRIFASEIMRGAPVITDHLETTLKNWLVSRSAIVRRWIEEGKLADGRSQGAVLPHLVGHPALRRLRPPDRGAQRRQAALGRAMGARARAR